MLWVKIYVDDIIFGLPNLVLGERFAALMKYKCEISMMGKMSWFLGLQVKKVDDGIFINQAKYT